MLWVPKSADSLPRNSAQHTQWPSPQFHEFLLLFTQRWGQPGQSCFHATNCSGRNVIPSSDSPRSKAQTICVQSLVSCDPFCEADSDHRHYLVLSVNGARPRQSSSARSFLDHLADPEKSVPKSNLARAVVAARLNASTVTASPTPVAPLQRSGPD